MSQASPSEPSNTFNRGLIGLTWILFMVVAFFVPVNWAADEMGYDLNVKIFACLLAAGLAFVGLSAVVWRAFNAMIDAL